jgi:hypothetical protein
MLVIASAFTQKEHDHRMGSCTVVAPVSLALQLNQAHL